MGKSLPFFDKGDYWGHWLSPEVSFYASRHNCSFRKGFPAALSGSKEGLGLKGGGGPRAIPNFCARRVWMLGPFVGSPSWVRVEGLLCVVDHFPKNKGETVDFQ